MTDPQSEPVAPTGFRAPPPWVVFLFLFLGIGAVAVAFFVPIKPPVPASPPPEAVVTPPDYPDAPPFLLTERNGERIDRSALHGKVWVAEFAFSRCQLCPQVAGTMGKLRGELNLTDRDDFRLVTFTVDPDHDTAAELRKYAGTFTKEDDRRWLFLTSDHRGYVEDLCRWGFKVGLEEEKDQPASRRFKHYLDLMVIDRKGKVRGHYPGLPPERDDGQKVYDEGYAALKAKVTEVLGE